MSFASPASPTNFSFEVQTAQPSATPVVKPCAGTAIAIPDGDAAGVKIPLVASGLGTISGLNLKP